MMTEWGTRMVDDMNALCTVEATTSARWMYEKAGFVVERHFALEVPDKFSDRPVERLFIMVRPRARPE
ncbi:hypothetical protein BDV96DRAFT_646186 [Lophiotrema nucula]|uniref:N-acetyltransferase domain-containing protein n=1 Tax=Lophiotrema nucula TaxID=690887 RepID=A0A6A5Z7A0_9PLEO|nr:hypothetical protein BDV96DRAFT_646186 [Lophiotrema nucula]